MKHGYITGQVINPKHNTKSADLKNRKKKRNKSFLTHSEMTK